MILVLSSVTTLLTKRQASFYRQSQYFLSQKNQNRGPGQTVPMQRRKSSKFEASEQGQRARGSPIKTLLKTSSNGRQMLHNRQSCLTDCPQIRIGAPSKRPHRSFQMTADQASNLLRDQASVQQQTVIQRMLAPLENVHNFCLSFTNASFR
jgi:hypothetical protein